LKATATVVETCKAKVDEIVHFAMRTGFVGSPWGVEVSTESCVPCTMALLTCVDCGREISDAAPACPGCGRPASTAARAAPSARAASAAAGPVGIVLVIGGALLIGWCALRKPTADSTATVAPTPVVTADEPAAKPGRPVPDLATLRADVAKVVPELRQHVVAGTTKVRAPPDCIGDHTRRLKQLAVVQALVGQPVEHMMWPEPQSDLADALNEVVTELRGCVNCFPGDVKDCALAEKAIAKLQQELAKR
jgi:hypothetical protein